MDINKFSNIRNPVFPGPDFTLIDLTCDIEGQGVGVVFTASATDIELYGRELYQNAMNGDFGEIAPYVEPVVDSE